jgi:photosystem II stability/assembly factor-like uncharacterized protein
MRRKSYSYLFFGSLILFGLGCREQTVEADYNPELDAPLDGAWTVVYTDYSTFEISSWDIRLQFMDPDVGWLYNGFAYDRDPDDPSYAPPYSALFKTIDGGASWSAVTMPGPDQFGGPVYMVPFHRDTFLLFASYDDLWETNDGGETWKRIPVNGEYQYQGTPNDAVFMDRDNGWIVNVNGIYHTVDGGVTWTRQYGGSFWGWFEPVSISMMNFQEGWAFGVETRSGTLDTVFVALLHTTDGGENWEVQWARAEEHDEYDLNALGMIFLDGQTGYLAYDQELKSPREKIATIMLTTGDGGNTWVEVSLPEKIISDFEFVSPDVGWIVGESDTGERFVYRTADGGATWERQPAAMLGSPVDVQFVDENHGWIAFREAVILRTTTGGTGSGS